MMRLGLCLILVILAAVGPAQGGSTLLTTGNGHLTVSVNSEGGIESCLWPSPGYCEQLGPPEGLRWALRVGDETLWLPDPRLESSAAYGDGESCVIESSASWGEMGLKVTQTVFVIPGRDVLVMRLEVRGTTDVPDIYLHADFSPRTRVMPELAMGSWFGTAPSDFAAVGSANRDRVYHFRPEQLTNAHWRRAEALASQGGPMEAWSELGRGVWIGCASPQDIVEMQCGEVATPSSALGQVMGDSLGGDTAAVGQCDYGLKLAPLPEGDAFVGQVFLAFGHTLDVVEGHLAFAERQGYEALRTQTDTYWREWLSRASPLKTSDADLEAAFSRCLLTLGMAVDATTGAVACGRGEGPADSLLAKAFEVPLDWPAAGAWVTLALDAVGLHDLARDHTLFYSRAVRTDGRRGRPVGSLPLALYANGDEALPHLLLGLDGAAWTLWSFGQHGALLEEVERTGYLTELWPSVEKLGDFLAGWSETVGGVPYHGFGVTEGRDRHALFDIPLVYVGMTEALKIAEALGHGKPQWVRRSRSLEALTFLHCLDDRGHWRLERTLPMGPSSEIPWSSDAQWRALVDAKQARLPQLAGYEAARALCEVALEWRETPQRLETLRPEARRVLLESGSALAPADPLTAALALLGAAMILTSDE